VNSPWGGAEVGTWSKNERFLTNERSL